MDGIHVTEKPLYLDDKGIWLYDVAFGWRRTVEADYVVRCLAAHGAVPPARVLDVACGAGHFLEEGHKRGWMLAGVDYSPGMLVLGRQRVGPDAQLVVADMSEFAVTGTFDVATCWLDSFTYMLTDADILRHFQCVARALKREGMYLLDLSFSRWAEPFWRKESSQWKPSFDNGWTAVRGDFEVYHDGCCGPPCDPVAHLVTEYMYFRVTDRMSGKVEARCYTALKRALHPQTFAALVSASNVFELLNWSCGDFQVDSPFNLADSTGRSLVLLRQARG